MKTPKNTQVKEKNLAAPAGGKVTKNKAKGKNPLASTLDPAKVKLGLQKAKGTVQVKDGKNLQKKGEMKKQVFNGKGSPQAENGAAGVKVKVGKKKKSKEGVKPEVVANEKKSKKNKGVAKSPEVQLGLKIEKLLESPTTGKLGKKNKRKRKGAANAEQKVAVTAEQKAAVTAEQKAGEAQTPTTGSPGKNKKKKKKGKQQKAGSSPVAAKAQTILEIKEKPAWDTPVPLGPFPSRPNAENAVKALLKHLKEYKSKKPNLLDDYEPLLVCIDFFKKPAGRRLQRALLPHHYLGNNPDVVFIVCDNKKKKRDFDESIDAHRELFKSRGVTNISEIIPWKKLSAEYTQYEEKRKLAGRADAFLIDSKLSHRWPAIMKKKLFKRKAPIPVRVDKTSDLKKSMEIAMRKVALILGNNSFSISPQFGHTKMNVKALVDNLITVVTVVCDERKYPGGQANIRAINIRGAKSEAFPVFISTASPNSVETPKPKAKKMRESVEGEVTTAGVSVVVHPSGHVQIKSKDRGGNVDEAEHETSPKKKKDKRKADSDDDVEEDSEDDDDDDSEIDSDLLDKFMKANQASEDEDESSDEEEIEKAEQEFLLALRKQQDSLEAEAQAKSKKAGKKMPVVEEASSDEDDDDDDDLDDDDVLDLIPAKKPKPQAQQPKKGKNAKQSPMGKPAQNGFGKGKPSKGKPGVQAQISKGGAGKKGPQGGKGSPNQKANIKASPKAQQRYFNKGGKKK